MQDVISQEFLESIFHVNSKTKTIQWQSLLNDNSRDSRSALKLADDVAAGKYDVGGSRLPIDFHQFYAIFRDKTDDQTWVDIVNMDHTIMRSWAFNCIVSNYPTVSFSDHFSKFISTINDRAYFPAVNALRLLIDFYLTFDNPTEDITCTRPEALRSAYAEWIGKNKTYKRYKHLDVTDKPNHALSFFNNKLSPSFSGVQVSYNNRVYYPLVPTELVNNSKCYFHLSDLIFILR